MDASAVFAGVKYLLPEAFLLAAAAVALFVHLFAGRKGARAAGWIVLGGILAAGAALFLTPQNAGPIYGGSLSVDLFAAYFKAVILLAGALSVLLAFRFFGVERYEPGEAYILIALSMIGMTVAAAATDLISSYVAFELFAIPSYLLAGIFKKDKRSSEAGVKFFFLGTLSSGVMLLGMALVFGLTGETNYAAVSAGLPGTGEPIVLAGMILFFSGLFFKAALVPFHMWAPDVYEGAPTPVTVFLATASKAAVLAVLIRALTGIFGAQEIQWTSIFRVLAFVTMFWGNLAALTQKSLKRMMAYSSVAHAGYLAIGLAAWGEEARSAVLFYILIYAVMNAAGFALVLLVRREAGFGEDIDGLRGLAGRSPLLAGAVIVTLLALAGIPPTAGFMGKYFLFAAAMNKGLVLLTVAGALNSVISLFYYFRIGRAVFLEEEAGRAEFSPSWPVSFVIVLSAAVSLLLGILPSLLTGFADLAVLPK
jgi:NADH-quinone oxidoreductase subunit N